ncbi:SPFH domain-containing protein [Hydrogenophaga sp. 5NK40-0174]|uniref:SPFH domain-containing protein n=1 Tax=Hydrogenophaga sp. 5NK40-0174 TaxID=3127649 RepID=UPI00310AF4D2
MSMISSIQRFWRRLTGREAASAPLPDLSNEARNPPEMQGPPAPPKTMTARPPLRWPVLPWRSMARTTVVFALVGGMGWVMVQRPPVVQLKPGFVGVRSNLLTGSATIWRSGSAWVLPGVHRVKVYSTQDTQWAARELSRADGPAPAQSVEGLSIGIDLKLRYALDLGQMDAQRLASLPTEIDRQIVEPAVQSTVYKLISRHTVREIFSTDRDNIEAALTAQIGERLSKEGLVLRSLHIGQIDLPPDYKRGMEALLTQGLEAEKMRYTLELRDKQVKERKLLAAADKAQREIAAEAAARERVIAAKAKEEAMKHVLPFKQRQIEQRKLEAEAARVKRIKRAQAEAEARKIEAMAEAEARQKLADAEAYRLASLGKVEAEQMAVQGEIITRHPLLIQKTMADRLSDKVQVIIASPPQGGGFIGDNLLGQPLKVVHNGGH